jgi:2-oxoglutarate dehydrogenase E2 component (dihydrolipoamide succinyltransferase)
MSVVEVKIPEVGESITEGLLVEWSVADGGQAKADEPLLVLETDKITMTVNAEASGVLSIGVEADSTVEVGQVVGTIDTEATADDGDGAPQPDPAETTEAEAPAAEAPDVSGLSPAVARLVAEHDLNPADIEGTGKDGRILKGDVLAHLEAGDAGSPAAPQPEPAPPKAAAPAASAPAAEPPVVQVSDGPRQTREPMTRLRQRLAERLVEVQQTAAILTTFNEADMSGIMALRSRYKEDFAERHGIGLGFMSFFVKAAVDALKTVPEVNSWIENGEVVQNHYYDIGVAVSSPKGLVVPVVRNADLLSFAQVEAEIKRLAGKAQDRTLDLGDLSGGTFTVSNGGIFGSMMSTPILNPPQSAILGMHAIKKRPVVVGDEIVIRPMMYLALSYDHRIVDGREAVTFLKRICDCIESPERLMLEV